MIIIAQQQQHQQQKHKLRNDFLYVIIRSLACVVMLGENLLGGFVRFFYRIGGGGIAHAK